MPANHDDDPNLGEIVVSADQLEERAAEVGGGWRVARTGGRLRLVRPV
jgi:hypothetical protein